MLLFLPVIDGCLFSRDFTPYVLFFRSFLAGVVGNEYSGRCSKFPSANLKFLFNYERVSDRETLVIADENRVAVSINVKKFFSPFMPAAVIVPQLSYEISSLCALFVRASIMCRYGYVGGEA